MFTHRQAELSGQFGPCHAKTYIQAYADSEGPDQSAQPQSDQGFAVHL